MALRTKTIEYAFVTNTASTTAGTKHSFTTQTIYIPETSSRTFRSVILEITCRDTVTVATALTAPTIGIILGGNAESGVNMGNPPSASGSGSHCFQRNVTSYFTSNFGSGSSQTCQPTFTASSVGVTNQTARLYITYEYEDSSATTRVKTVRIPIECPNSLLTNTLTEFGTNQIPVLDTFLPEASKTYRNIFFEVLFNESKVTPTSGADPTLQMSLDAEAAHNTGIYEYSVGTSSPCGKYIWNRQYYNSSGVLTGSYDATVTHQWRMAVSNTTSFRFEHPATVMVVTYEYDHSNSTTIMNSLILPFTEVPQLPLDTTSSGNQRQRLEFWVEEPNTITLRQSGYVCCYDPVNGVSITVAMNSQTYFTYSNTGTSNAPSFFCRRIDGSAGSGSALSSFSRGRNTLDFNYYTSGSGLNRVSSPYIYIILNYTSGKHSDGDGVHAHTTLWSIAETSANSNNLLVSALALANIPESNYFLVSYPGLYDASVAIVEANYRLAYFIIELETLSGEGIGGGWEPILNAQRYSIGVTGWVPHWGSGDKKLFNQYPNDPDDLMNIESSRRVRFCGGSQRSSCFALYVTYNAITFTISGTVNGYTGDGSGITVDAHRTDNGALIDTVTTSSGGDYSITWYDDTIDVFTQSRQNASNLGRSDNGRAI
jgi:hypothetical protein